MKPEMRTFASGEGGRRRRNSGRKLPNCMQIIGPSFRDEVPFRVAMAYGSRYRFFVDEEFPELR